MSTQKASYIWFNGRFVAWENAQVHVMSHALHYGSSVFEGIRAYQTPQGPAIFRLDDHIQRLFDSAKIYRMNIPYTFEELKQACVDSVIENQLTGNSYLRPLAFLGDVGPGVNAPRDAKADVMIAAFPWSAYLGKDSLQEGVDAQVTSWQRLAPNTMPTAAKAGGNYLSSQLISGEAKRHGYHEGIALNVDGCVSEGAGENLFVVKQGRLITPPATAAILPGITRDSVCLLAKNLGYDVVEQSIPREALYLADEVMMTGTAAEIVPVRSVDRIQVGNGKAGPITRAIQQAYFGMFSGETETPDGWLTHTIG